MVGAVMPVEKQASNLESSTRQTADLVGVRAEES